MCTVYVMRIIYCIIYCSVCQNVQTTCTLSWLSTEKHVTVIEFFPVHCFKHQFCCNVVLFLPN